MLLISTYPMWYNVRLNPSLHPTYPIGTKGFDPLIFKNYTCYVPRYVYPVLEQPIVPPTHTPHSIGNQFPTMVQPIINMDR
jgi:hypothetical protein